MRVTPLVAMATVSLLVPAPAGAQEDRRTTVVYAGAAIYVTAAPGVVNTVVALSEEAGTVQWQDYGPGIVNPGGECTPAENGLLSCPLAGIDRVYVRLLDGDDRFYSTGPGFTQRFVAEGGEGDDLLGGRGSTNWFVGGDGNDRLFGFGGADLLDGGPGDDDLAGYGGADDLRGGPGRDTVDYYPATGPVTADLDGARDDGSAGEGDVIRPDVENLRGSRFSDRLSGNDGPNRMDGGPGGQDVIWGHGGNDYFVAGTHVFKGGDGVDTVVFSGWPRGASVTLDNAFDVGGHNVAADVENVVGSSFGDWIVGSGLPNTIRGGGGRDTLHGLGGNDVLIGDAGPDALHGSGGVDRCALGPQGGTVTGCP